MAIPDQIVVKLQYSNKLGDVTQSNLQALLDDLSKVRAFIATSHALIRDGRTYCSFQYGDCNGRSRLLYKRVCLVDRLAAVDLSNPL